MHVARGGGGENASKGDSKGGGGCSLGLGY